MEVLVTVLPPGGGAFLAALEQGADLDAAVRRATAFTSAFDLPATLATLFGSGAITRIETPTPGSVKAGAIIPH
jgi:hypothetical protein